MLIGRKNMIERAFVTCHMYVSMDGKIETGIKGYPDCEVAGEIYDQITFSSSKAWGCGRATFQYLSDEVASLEDYEPYAGELKDHFIKDEIYCFAFDRLGKLFFKDAYNDYANKKSRFVSVLTHNVDRRFITYLNKKGISYIFAGKKELDLPLFLKKIYDLGIKHFYLCGGAQINALFMEQDLIDEISLIIAPGVQGGRKEVTFVGTEDVSKFPKYFKIKEVKVLDGDTVHLIYERKD